MAVPQDELRRFVDQLAREPERWRALVRHDAGRRTFEELLLDHAEYAREVGVWLICWMNDHDTGFHDHDMSSGAVAVVAGQLREERLAIGSVPRTRTYGAGESFDFSNADIHRMSHAGGGPAISIHAYSPPLQRMGAYVIEPDGVLTRTPVSYEEELRPLHASEADPA